MLSTTAMAFAAGGYNAWLIDFLERDKQHDAKARDQPAPDRRDGRRGRRHHRRRPARRSAAPTHAAGRLWTIAIGMACTIPCAVAAHRCCPAGPALYVAGIATMFFISWYHAPMAVTVDDLAPPERAVAAQGLVIFTMHLVGTAPSS